MSVVDDYAALAPQGKSISVQAAVQAMIVTVDHVWIALADGGVEVRHGRTADLVHRFESAPRPTAVTRVWTLLAVQTRDKNAHVWMGLSSGVIEVYDAKSFHMVRQLNKHAGGVYCLAEFGGFVYSGSSDFQIAQWYAENGRFVRIFRGHKSYVRCLYAEGSAIVSGSDDCTVRVWDAGSGETQLKGYFHGRAGVSALCRVGVTMWSGDNEGRVIAWKLSTCEALRVLQAHGGRVMSLRKIGSRVYSGGADGVIAVFDAEDGQLVQRVEDHMGFRLTTVQCAWECGRYSVWTAMSDKTVRCWHHDELRPMTGEQERLNDMRWYYATLLPDHEVNEQILKRQHELSELAVLAQGGGNAIHQILSMNEEMRNSSLLKCWSLVEQTRESEKETHAIQDERARVQTQIQKDRQNLECIRALLQKTLEALQKVRGSGTFPQLPRGDNAGAPSTVTSHEKAMSSPATQQAVSTNFHPSNAIPGTTSMISPPQSVVVPPNGLQMQLPTGVGGVSSISQPGPCGSGPSAIVAISRSPATAMPQQSFSSPAEVAQISPSQQQQQPLAETVAPLLSSTTTALLCAPASLQTSTATAALTPPSGTTPLPPSAGVPASSTAKVPEPPSSKISWKSKFAAMAKNTPGPNNVEIMVPKGAPPASFEHRKSM